MQVISKVLGKELVGIGYQPLFPYFAHLKADSCVPNGTAAKAHGAFRVVADGYVTADNGTGIVHSAPAFGEDDMRVSLANGEQCLLSLLPCQKWLLRVILFQKVMICRAGKEGGL